ncbi:Hypothetical Protein FCC1311_041852 [Hondaea fermentalgiana]|uniref:Uncharacterized protein n=1 Tax=Hondaea fermentalgiana TaxID=2315210 RepID=A0A2R5GAD1_9STRA|nr:Hypothetical Protein FCC1311_041852 [Hondaea fermentalgiana]|eukprot:GBG27962.1 Hypothetical Protein FCC1311_041852 [Hondaea fermentalgiana]
MTKMMASMLVAATAVLATMSEPALAGPTAKQYKNKGILVQMLESDAIEQMLNTSEFEAVTTCGPMCASWSYSVKGLPLVLPQDGSGIGLAIKRSGAFVNKYAQAMAPYYFSPESRQFCAEPSSSVPTLEEIPANNTPADFDVAGCGSDSTCQMIAAGGGVDYALFENEAFANETCAQDTLDSGDCEICQESYTCSEYFGNNKFSGGDIVDTFVAPWFDSNSSTLSETNAGVASTMCVLEASRSSNWNKLEDAYTSVLSVLSDYDVTDYTYAYPEVTTYVPIDEDELTTASNRLSDAVLALIYRVPESPTAADNEEYLTAYQLAEQYNDAHKSSIEMFNCTGTFEDGDDFSDSLPVGCTKVL